MTDSASSLRNSPLSIRMHEACVPTAWANRAATTEESTPPDKPADHPPLPTRLRIASMLSRAKSPSFHVPVATANRSEKIAEDLRPQRRVRHLGMKLQAVDRQPAVLHRGKGQVSVAASGRKSSETAVTWSPWLIHTWISGGRPANSSSRVVQPALGPAVLPRRALPRGRPGPRTPTASRSRCPARACRAGKCPDRTSAPPPHRRSTARRRESIPAGPTRGLRGRNVVADDLAIDLLLANPPGDQLRILGAEIQHQDLLVRDLRHAALPGENPAL